MNRKCRTEEQIIGILNEYDIGQPDSATARRISSDGRAM